MYFFDIGHPCYGQLTPVKTRYPLVGLTGPYRGLKFRLIEVTCFLKLTADQELVFDWIAGLCQVNLLYNQSQVVRKMANVNSVLNVNQSINFLYKNVFHYFCFVLFEIAQAQNRRPNSIKRKSHRKVRKLRSWVSLIGL